MSIDNFELLRAQLRRQKKEELVERVVLEEQSIARRDATIDKMTLRLHEGEVLYKRSLEEKQALEKKVEECGRYGAEQHRRAKELEAEVARLRYDCERLGNQREEQALALAKSDYELGRYRRLLAVIEKTAQLLDE